MRSLLSCGARVASGVLPPLVCCHCPPVPARILLLSLPLVAPLCCHCPPSPPLPPPHPPLTSQDGAYADVLVKLGLIKLLQKRFDVCEEA